MAGGDERTLVRVVALPRVAGRSRRAGGRWPNAGRPGNDPVYGFLWNGRERPAVSFPRGAGWWVGWSLLRRRQRRYPHRPGFPKSAGRVHRDALSIAGREAGTARGFRRRG